MEDDILQMFLEDTREHLADIETDLLDIEEAGPDFDIELVNKVFRTAHSIKGSAGFLALDNVRDLSHKIENVLDMVRSREIIPTPVVVNIILRAFDQLEVLVENIEQSEQIDISQHVAELIGLVTDNLPKEQQQLVTTRETLCLPDGREVFTLSKHDLAQARKGGNFIYLVEYDLIHDVHQKNMTPLELIKSIEKSGFIIDCRMDISQAGDLESPPSNRIPFYILYASILEPDLIQAIFQVEQAFIHTVPSPEEVAIAASDEIPLTPESAPSGPEPVAPPAEPDSPSPARIEASAPETPTVEDVTETVAGFDITTRGSQVELALAGALGIENANDVKAALLATLDKGSEILVNLAKVEKADLVLLQMLWAASISAKQKGKAITPMKASQAVVAAARRAGFDSLEPRHYGVIGQLFAVGK